MGSEDFEVNQHLSPPLSSQPHTKAFFVTTSHQISLPLHYIKLIQLFRGQERNWDFCGSELRWSQDSKNAQPLRMTVSPKRLLEQQLLSGVLALVGERPVKLGETVSQHALRITPGQALQGFRAVPHS